MRNTGAERLTAYRKKFRLNQLELADLLQIHFTTLSKVLSGQRRPGLDAAVRIEKITGIPVESWLDTEVGRSAAARAAKAKTARFSKVSSVA